MNASKWIYGTVLSVQVAAAVANLASGSWVAAGVFAALAFGTAHAMTE